MPGKHRAKIQYRASLYSELPAGSHVWVYLRHSPGDEQTITSQRLAVAAYCEQKGLIIDRWFIDEAKSGGTIESREAFEAMLSASRERRGAVAGIVVWDLSRFSRDLLEPQFYLADLRIRGYRVVSIKDEVPSGEFASIFESLILWKNHRYLMDLSANVRRGHDATINSVVEVDGRAITGFSCGGFPPVGYDAARIVAGTKPSGRPRHLVYWKKTEDETVRAKVEGAWRSAVEQARAGGWIEVARIHQTYRVHTNVSTYYHFFRSVTYKGTRHVGERLVDCAHEPYVSPEEWDLVQRHLRVGRISPKEIHPRRIHSPFYLSGRVVCGVCGARLDFESDNRVGHYVALRCAGRKKHISCCDLSKISYQVFMADLMKILTGELLRKGRSETSAGDVAMAMGPCGEEIEGERRRIELELLTTKKAMGRLVDALERGQDIELIEERLRERQQEKRALEARLREIAEEKARSRPPRLDPKALSALLRKGLADVEAIPVEEARVILQELVHRVTVWTDRVRVEFSPEPAPIRKRAMRRAPMGKRRLGCPVSWEIVGAVGDEQFDRVRPALASALAALLPVALAEGWLASEDGPEGPTILPSDRGGERD